MNQDSIDEPLLVYFPIRRRLDANSVTQQQPLERSSGSWELTALRIYGPGQPSESTVMRAAESTGAVAFHQAREHYAELGFGGERQGHLTDLRPRFPLVFCG
jgi:hypothetical protein